MMMNKFHYIKFGIIQIGLKALSQIQILNTPNSSPSQIQIKEPDTKYEFCTNHRESHKSNPKVATHQEEIKSPNRKTKIKQQQTSLTIPNCNSQILKNQTTTPL